MLTIVRHGRTAANAGGLLQGHIDNSLDSLGKRQASEIAGALGEVDVVVCSPLTRAIETAKPLGITPVIDDRWIELDYGDWDGQPVSSIGKETWAQWRSDDTFTPPGGESLASLNRRVYSACEDLQSLAESQHVVVFTHVSPIKSAISWALSCDEEISWNLRVSQAQISRILVQNSRQTLLSFNEVAHLTS
jgi:alpha-ribazole phosphatase|tara:strand:- start:331 stop:903 length:573 start_codon:yes stop_codon:yes gene_type:complete